MAIRPVLEIPTCPPVWGGQFWRRPGNFLLIFLHFYVDDLRFKTWGPTTFLNEFQTLDLTPCSAQIQCKLLTHWGRVTHLCVGKLTIIGSDNGLSPERRQANIWTNAGILLIGTLGTNSSEILSEIHIFSFKKMPLKMASAKWRPFCLGLNGLMHVFTGHCNC